MHVWRVSPYGVEVVGGADAHLKPGDQVNLQLRVGDQVLTFADIPVQTQTLKNGNYLFGLSLRGSQSPTPDGTMDRRGKARFFCSPAFSPTGVAANPVRFNDRVYFHVRDVSATGMCLVTSMRNKYLLPGLRVSATVAFPVIGNTRVDLVISRSRIELVDGEDRMVLGAKLLNPNQKDLSILGQYLLELGQEGRQPLSIGALRAAGLYVQSASRALDFTYATTEDDYRQVLALRKVAYSRAGKVKAELSAADMGDEFDKRSRILIAKYRGTVVGSMRLIYNGQGDKMEHEQYTALPDNFPPRDEIVEVTRICTHPDYRGEDLLVGMFAHCAVTSLQSGKRWILGSATKKLLPIYERVGGKTTEVSYRHEALGGDEHFIVLLDLQKRMLATGITPIQWTLVYRDAWKHVDFQATIGFLSRLRLVAYRSLEPITNALIGRALQRRRGGK
jgi:N-acyl-L-homoserine lactone synthetase